MLFTTFVVVMKSKSDIKLSKLELQVMNPFWKEGEITIRRAADVLAEAKDDHGYSTVQTIAGRLEKKGAIAKTRKDGKAWLFKACVEKKRVVGRLLDDLLGLVDGMPNPILSHLVENEKIGREELDELREMIDQKATKQTHNESKFD